MTVAAVWALRVASVMLLLAAFRLARRAHELGMDAEQALWMAPLALLAGGFKSSRVMLPLLRRDANWLRSQRRVPFWRLFPPRLMLFIAGMIAASAVAKRLSADFGWGLASLSAMDLAVAGALLLTSLALPNRG